MSSYYGCCVLDEKFFLMKCVSRVANILSFLSRRVATRFEIVTKGRIEEGVMRIKYMGNGRRGQQHFQSCAWS
jgi:hypothetical protein